MSYKIGDIENVVLTQENGVPVTIKDVGSVAVSYWPSLGILGRDEHDDVVGAIVVQRRTEKTADMILKVEEAIQTLNRDGSLPPGRQGCPLLRPLVPGCLTTHTVLHNPISGCTLVFLIQWIFLGNLRSAVIVGLIIPLALCFATILLVMMGGKTVILVENIFRNWLPWVKRAGSRSLRKLCVFRQARYSAGI